MEDAIINAHQIQFIETVYCCSKINQSLGSQYPILYEVCTSDAHRIMRSFVVASFGVLSFAIILTPKTHVFAYPRAVFQYVKGTHVIYLYGRREVWMSGKLIGCRNCLLILWKDVEVLPGVRGNVSQCTWRRSLARRRRVGVYNLTCFWSSEFL